MLKVMGLQCLQTQGHVIQFESDFPDISGDFLAAVFNLTKFREPPDRFQRILRIIALISILETNHYGYKRSFCQPENRL
ncbi:MAG: hypothetical protein ACPGJE_01445 [Wenzhouxiangellaceae bacterium]